MTAAIDISHPVEDHLASVGIKGTYRHAKTTLDAYAAHENHLKCLVSEHSTSGSQSL